MLDLPLAAFPLLDAWTHSVTPVLDSWFARAQIIPDALLSLKRFQAILAPAAGAGAILGLLWPTDRQFDRSHPLVQRVSHAVGFAAFGLLCGFGLVFVQAMIAPILTK